MSMFSAKSTITTRNETYPFIAPSQFVGSLKDKVVLITCAGRGIGRTSALSFAAAGASVACLACRPDDVEATASEIMQNFGTSAVAIAADVADPLSPAKVVKDVESKLGPVDILLNSAGINRFGTLEAEEDFSDRWHVLETNLRGPVAFAHAVLRSMIAPALIKFHQDLAVELEGKGVYGFCVHPGTVATDLGTTSSAINMKSVQLEPRMQEMLSTFGTAEKQTPELAANTITTLCANEELRLLNGKYTDSEQDLGEVLQDAKKGKESRIQKERLYHLKLDEL